MEYIVEIQNINKTYLKNKVLDNVSLNLERGKIYGLLGVNGAGKTTLIRVITGLISFHSDSMKLFGSMDLNNARKKIGATIESPVLFESLSAKENLRIYNSLFGLTEETLDGLLGMVGLENSKKPVKKFSLGMRQRLSLSIALLGSPEFVILDEPTNGLDPIAIRDCRSLIEDLNQKNNISFLISSHDVNELVKISDVLLFMQDGKLIGNYDTESIIQLADRKNLSTEDYIINMMEKRDA